MYEYYKPQFSFVWILLYEVFASIGDVWGLASSIYEFKKCSLDWVNFIRWMKGFLTDPSRPPRRFLSQINFHLPNIIDIFNFHLPITNIVDIFKATTKAAWWVNHVCRHRGTPWLKTFQAPFYQVTLRVSLVLVPVPEPIFKHLCTCYFLLWTEWK